MKRSFKIAAGVALTCSIAAATPAVAEDGWEYTGLIYLWGAGIGGETVTGEDVDVSFSDILDNLEFGIMGTLEARNGPWAIFGDAIYLNIADDQEAAVGPGIPVTADVDVQGFVFTTGVGYDLVSTAQYRLNGFGGLRYLDMDTNVNIGLGGGSQRVRDAFSNWDAIVGLRGQYELADRWDLNYYADIGTGNTDLTYQAALAVDYNFEKWSLTLGYRHLAWQDLNDSQSLTDVDFSGPFLGAKFQF